MIKRNQRMLNAFNLISDGILIVLSYVAALWLRFDCQFSAIPAMYLTPWLRFIPIYTVFCLITFHFCHLYRSLWRFASYNELIHILTATVITGFFHILAITLLFERMPISYYILGIGIQFVMVIVVRFAYRFILLERSKRQKSLQAAKASRVMLIGAGAAGQMILRDLHSAQGAQYSPYIRVGDENVSLAVLAPSVSPIIMGATAYDILKESDDKVQAFTNALTSSLDQIFDASYMSGLADLFDRNGTIAENIAYGSEGATLDDVKAAAKAARIDAYIESLPRGYDTVMDENGMNISKGQKQLITIARAFLSKAPILILDEATAAMDTKTEKTIQNALTTLTQGKTTIMIAHRLSTLRDADKLIVIEHGKVAEEGTHAELLAKEDGVYRKLYTLQLEALKNAGIAE